MSKHRFNLSELSSNPIGKYGEAFGILRSYEDMTGSRETGNRRRLINIFDDKSFAQDVICSLWDDTAENFTDMANVGDIIYLCDATICYRIKKDICGLTASGASCVKIDPPHQVAKELARWRDRCFLEPADLTQIINDYLTVENSANNRERGDEINIVHGETRRVKKQPSMLTGGRLVAYQVDGLDWLVSLFSKNLNGILADEIGLSKPIQIAAFIAYLNEINTDKPILLVVPAPAFCSWFRLLSQWVPSDKIIAGKTDISKHFCAATRLQEFVVLIATHEAAISSINQLVNVEWGSLIFDRDRLNQHSDELIKRFARLKAPKILLADPSPRAGHGELWAFFSFLIPKRIMSLNRFIVSLRHTVQKSSSGDLQEETQRFYRWIRPLRMSREKRHCFGQLSHVTELIVKCDLSAVQRVILHQQETEGMSDLKKAAFMLERITNHPFLDKNAKNLLGESMFTSQDSCIIRASGKFHTLDQILSKLLGSDHKILLVCFNEELRSLVKKLLSYRAIKFLCLEHQSQIARPDEPLGPFNHLENDNVVFLVGKRIKSLWGAQVKLRQADTVIIVDSDFDGENGQVLSPASFIIDKDDVRVLRLVSVYSVEDEVLRHGGYQLGMNEGAHLDALLNSTNRRTPGDFIKCIFEQRTCVQGKDLELPGEEAMNRMLARTEQEYKLYKEFTADKEKLGLLKDKDVLGILEELFRQDHSGRARNSKRSRMDGH